MNSASHGPRWLERGKAEFRLWAPSADSVQLLLNGHAPQSMARDANGWCSITCEARPGQRYRFLIDRKLNVPDPASRFQPDGVDGASELIDTRYGWKTDWHGRPWEEAVLYELHVGTFSPEGNYAGIEHKLDYLAGLGITAIELMPLATFSGQRGWGYDGVYPFAPHAAYGRPEHLKRLVDEAHARGLMVFLDVVYNHFGPSGNYLHHYAKPFFTDKYHTRWGAAINFESEQPVRDFFIENALYWLSEYRFDGLRLDAVDAIYDASPKPFLLELARKVRQAFPKRHLIVENDFNQASLMERKDSQPACFTAQWNDDYHHIWQVLLTAEQTGYYEDYVDDTVEKLGRSLAEGFVYQGEPSEFRGGEPRGEKSAFLPPAAFVNFLQNHDQIGNRAFGERLNMLTETEKLELALRILLLSPAPPLLFMGEEWAASTPFLYFCDFSGELAEKVREGRRKEVSRFTPLAQNKSIPDPNSLDTFLRSRLDWQEAAAPPHNERMAFMHALLELRRKHVVPLLSAEWQGGTYRVIGGNGLEVRWRFGGKILQLLANLSECETGGFEPISGDCFEGRAGTHIPAWSCAWIVGHDAA